MTARDNKGARSEQNRGGFWGFGTCTEGNVPVGPLILKGKTAIGTKEHEKTEDRGKRAGREDDARLTGAAPPPHEKVKKIPVSSYFIFFYTFIPIPTYNPLVYWGFGLVHQLEQKKFVPILRGFLRAWRAGARHETYQYKLAAYIGKDSLYQCKLIAYIGKDSFPAGTPQNAGEKTPAYAGGGCQSASVRNLRHVAKQKTRQRGRVLRGRRTITPQP